MAAMMTKAIYLLSTALALVCAVSIVTVLYQSGGNAIPGWLEGFTPGPLSSSHAFLATSCESCHTPLRGVEAGACKACHANNAVLLSRQSTAFHATATTCSGCHIEHLGRSRPTQMDHQEFLNLAFRRVDNEQSIAEKLASFAQSLSLRTHDNGVIRSLDCASCHANRDPHRKLFGSECGACHAVAEWKVAKYRHPSPNSGDCAQCHQAPPSHYMMHFEMVSKTVARQEHAKVSECNLCHQTDSWNNIRGVGWYKHH